jgi:hypothetical protein
VAVHAPHGIETASRKSFGPLSALEARGDFSKYRSIPRELHPASVLIWNQNPNLETVPWFLAFFRIAKFAQKNFQVKAFGSFGFHLFCLVWSIVMEEATRRQAKEKEERLPSFMERDGVRN